MADDVELLAQLADVRRPRAKGPDAMRRHRERTRQPAESQAARVMLPTFKGERVEAGVNLDDGAAMLELMESERDSDRRARVSRPKNR